MTPRRMTDPIAFADYAEIRGWRILESPAPVPASDLVRTVYQLARFDGDHVTTLDLPEENPPRDMWAQLIDTAEASRARRLASVR